MTNHTTSGFGSLAKLGTVLGGFKKPNVLLVTGKGSFSACGAKPIVETALAGYSVVSFSDFDVNPKIEDAERGVELAREAEIDLIIAVGGGSVMDMAKLIKALYAQPQKSRELARGEVNVIDPHIPMIMVPTTAGSGSEATHFAVVYIGLDKFSLASQYLLPDHVILDGALIASGSPYQKACNGLDALSQAIESAWAAGSTEQSRDYSFEAVSLCASYLKKVVKAEPDEAALQGMMEASHLAGQAINISKTTAAHAWSYGITSHHGVPHGHAVWLTLPEIFKIHAKASSQQITHPLGEDHHKMVMQRLMETLGIVSADTCTEALKAFLSEINVESDMAKLGADTSEKRRFLSQQVNMQRMSNNPVSISSSEMSEIFRFI